MKSYKFDKFNDEPVWLGCVNEFKQMRNSYEEEFRIESAYFMDGGHSGYLYSCFCIF